MNDISILLWWCINVKLASHDNYNNNLKDDASNNFAENAPNAFKVRCKKFANFK
jgi:hypothetical protein